MSTAANGTEHQHIPLLYIADRFLNVVFSAHAPRVTRKSIQSFAGVQSLELQRVIEKEK